VSPDRDLDADAGAILVFPRRVVARHVVSVAIEPDECTGTGVMETQARGSSNQRSARGFEL
jgi:hypothetical protein